MQSWSKITHYAGFDWAHDHHEMVIVNHGWKALAKEDPLVAELRLLCRDEIALIKERTALINQLQSALREYYPAALEAFEDWTLPSAWRFVEAFPTPQALVSAGKRK